MITVFILIQCLGAKCTEIKKYDYEYDCQLDAVMMTLSKQVAHKCKSVSITKV